ncbi:peptidase M75 [Aliishimia ponticola]|uniref:Peptidase M75 n=1 Tax=Aliishimia ponticola TaxID=2499833 RepID=A0A4S4NBC3_9RHOB|nr:imelysin family protein [Aliishimia ponticola]THH36696.1 peptidase M75 [Aliishimia ponticola]
MRFLSLALSILLPAAHIVQAAESEAIVQAHILPRYALLDSETAKLADAAEADCRPQSEALQTAYHSAFDAWIGVAHLRFGPSEQGDRAFALAFWPDPRGSTPKALGALIRDADPALDAADSFASVSIAARGFYALEYLLYDPAFKDAQTAEYQCRLITAITQDIHRNAAAIRAGWEDGYGALLAHPGNDTYRSADEATRQVFTALSTGLEFNADTRLGRPLGTFDRPRPNRAEARRSGRSLRHVVLSLASLRELAGLISDSDAELDRKFELALERADRLDDPIFAGVADPAKRFRVEALQQSVRDIRSVLSEHVGPRLGIAAGFNSMDGD